MQLKRLLCLGLFPLAALFATGYATAGEPQEDSKAIEYGWQYTGDWVNGLSSSFREHTYLGALYFNLTLHNDKLLQIPGNTIFLNVLNTHGGKPNNTLGTLQGIDSIQSTVNTTMLYQAWMQQVFWGDKVSILAGLYDINSEFYITDSSLVFINPAMGLGSEFASSGLNGPDTFPLPGLGVRLQVKPNDAFYWLSGILDGVPGDLNNSYGTHITLSRDDGALVVNEVGFYYGADNAKAKFALGAWYYTRLSDATLDVDVNGNPVLYHEKGGYALFDIPIYRFDEQSLRGVNGFLRYGQANHKVDIFSHAIGLGLNFTGPFASRSEDVLGLAMTSAKVSQDARVASGMTLAEDEKIYEMTYLVAVNEYLQLQPDVQFVRPKNSATQQNSTIAMLRVMFEI